MSVAMLAAQVRCVLRENAVIPAKEQSQIDVLRRVMTSGMTVIIVAAVNKAATMTKSVRRAIVV